MPWLPAIDRGRAFGDGAKERRGVVLSLRRKKGKLLRRSQADLLDPHDEPAPSASGEIPEGWATGDILRDGSTRPADAIETPTDETRQNQMSGSQLSSTPSGSSNPWRDPTPQSSQQGRSRQRSYDQASGVIALPDEDVNVWDDSGSEGEENDHSPGEEPESPVSRP